MKKVVLLSGGIDSTTCLAQAVQVCGAENVTALCVFYGQKHSREMAAARKVAAYYGCLLYTSPSPRDRSVSRMPSSA